MVFTPNQPSFSSLHRPKQEHPHSNNLVVLSQACVRRVWTDHASQTICNLYYTADVLMNPMSSLFS